jgi:Carboxypeptidase regulatory-like domain
MRSFVYYFRGPRYVESARIPHAPLQLLLVAGAYLLFLSGCGSVSKTASTTTPSSPSSPAATYSISGTITPASDGSGATLALSGPDTASTTPNSGGNYSFTGLANGTYVVTPSNSGYSFSPTVQTVTVNGANATGVNFSASQSSSSSYSVGLNWTASVSTVSGYNVYRGTANGGPYTKLNSSLITSVSFTDNTVTSGSTYYYVSTSVNSSGVESGYSNQATAVIP